ncbi:HD-GYP domain-containing protein [Silanimonas sp.]|jgi:HD-GYP domain-containing protein (c-di-GMP phosphodiesterase class II)|uniref:HD-GYP domain-containing protein n=1 Tax=Silanimonas sp. TaxID=1929290 RepID=UPI0037C6C5D2
MELVAASGLGLKIGDRLEVAIVDRSGQVLLQKGKVIGTEAVLDRLNERGFFQRQTVEEEELSDLDRLEEQLHRESSTEGRLALLVEQIEKLLRSLVRPPSGTTWADLESVVRWLDELFVRDQDQFIGVQQLLAHSHTLSERALHAAAVAKLLAVAEGLPREVQTSLAAAALTVDVAVVEDHDDLALHPGDLLDHHKQMVADHPVRAVELLEHIGVHDPVWMQSVAMHHERLDGSGYPKGLAGAQIPIGARIVALADAFTAMMRPRADRPAYLAKDALRELFVGGATKFDARLVQLLVKQLGVYPPGTVVKLANGEIGVCVRRTNDARKPVLRAVIDPSGQLYATPKRRDVDETASKIVEVLPSDRHRNIRSLIVQLWKKDLELTESGG